MSIGSSNKKYKFKKQGVKRHKTGYKTLSAKDKARITKLGNKKAVVFLLIVFFIAITLLFLIYKTTGI